MSLVITALMSCSKDSDIEAADKDAITKTNSFVFEKEINNYVIDGQLTYDRTAIANAATSAWNIHYDYPHNKVVISTTPATFEKYKNSNLELKNALIENDIAARKHDIAARKNGNKELDNKDTMASKAVIGMHGGKYNALNFPGHRIFHYNDSANSRHYLWPVNVATNTSAGIYNVPNINSVGDLVYSGLLLTAINFFTGNSSKGYIRNTADNSDTVWTIYSGTNYTGTSRIFTLGRGTTRQLSTLNLLFNGAQLRSYK